MAASAMLAGIPRVSVVMSTFNRAELLKEALGSILALDPPAHEVVVIDDGSSDRTAEVLAGFGLRIRFEHRANGGKSSAINRAAAIATGDWIWICDDDDEVVPEAIGVFARGLAAAPGADFVYTGVAHLIRDGGGEYRQVLPGAVRLPPAAALEASLFAGRWIPYLPSVMIRRDLYQTLGGLREDLRRVEDEDFALRLVHAGRGAPIEAVTYLIRAHDGERGAGAAQFSNAMRQDVDITFLRGIYENVHRSYPLDAFRLPAEGVAFLPADPALFRLMIMFRVCAWGIVQREYRALRGVVQGGEALGALQDGISALVDCFSPGKLRGLLRSPFFAELLGDGATPLGAAILKGVARGCYWSLRRELRQRRFAGLAGRAWGVVRCSLAAKRRSAAGAR